MAFWDSLVGAKRTDSYLLIDIGATSVAGACAIMRGAGEEPALAYAKRVPIEARTGEAPEEAMSRALETVSDALSLEGAPALGRVGGNPHPRTVLVSLDDPWQETQLRTEQVERKAPFAVTRDMLKEALKRSLPDVPGKMPADESVIGTIINGYETRKPFGKRGRRVTFVVLTSLISTEIARRIVATLRKRFHHIHIQTIAGASLRYQALALTFPHEKDALLLDATSSRVGVALVRRGLLVAVADAAPGNLGTPEWARGISMALADLAAKYPLPRTILLLAREQEIANVRETLENSNLGKAWLADKPPAIVSVLASHLASANRKPVIAPDLVLELMLTYAQNLGAGKSDEPASYA